VILIGTNGKIAWGNTVVGYDVTDAYLEQLDGAGHVARPTGFVPLAVDRETIDVKGVGPTSYDIMISPGHGPLIGTTRVGGNTLGISFRWTGHEPSQEFAAFMDVDAAKSVDEALAAMTQFEVGAQNFVVGDDQGNIAYYPHAYVPIRGSNGSCVTPPWLPLPGWDGSCEWTGRIPDPPSCGGTATPGYLPCLKNPAQGWVATANNDVTGYTKTNMPLDPSHPYFYASTDLGYRHQRISERLAAQASAALDDMTSIQADTESGFARALAPAVVAWLGTRAADVSARGLGAAVSLLAHWGDPAASASDPGPYATPTGLVGDDPLGPASADAAVASRSAAAALFHAFVPRFARRILDDDLAVLPTPLSVNALLGLTGDQFLAKYLAALAGYAPGGTVPPVPLNTTTALCAAATAPAAACSQEALDALADAAAFLAQATIFGSSDPASWRWGRVHRVIFESNLSSLGVPIFDVGPFARRGGLYTVDVANFGWEDDGSAGFGPRRGFIVRAGPSVRFSAELAPGALRWRAVIAGGESDFPGDAHYGDQVPAWLSNAKGDLPYARADVEAAATAKITFQR
jgi:penicillin amidase